MSVLVGLRLLHVISAVLGGGLVAGVAVVASRSPSPSLLLRVTRWASFGLAATFLSAIALDVASQGALHERGWYRAAGLSMFACGALLAVVRRRAGRVASGAADAATLRPVPALAYAACGVVVWMTALMELQPF